MVSVDLGLGSLPESEQRLRQTFGLDPMWGVEVVALGERLDGEVGEERGEPLGHAAVVVRIAAAAECEVNRPIKCPQGIEIKLGAVKRFDEGP